MSNRIYSFNSNMVMASVNTAVVSASALIASGRVAVYAYGTDMNNCGFTSWHNR